MSNNRTFKESILDEVLNLLSEKYPHGLYDWLYKCRPDVYKGISDLEDRINSNFLCSGSVEELKTILRAYWVIHIRAIRDFKKSGLYDSTSDETRVERITKLETMNA